jgi:UDP-glucose-4-epimerase GalE
MRRMSILVTGGAGYVGSVTVDLLRARGEHVVVVDDLRHGHRDALDEDVPLLVGSVGDRALIERACREFSVDACVHFAARINVGESVTDPRRYFEDNAAESTTLLGALLDRGVKHVVFSSTCAVYGEPRQIPIPDDHGQDPVNPYGWSKLLIERVLRSYDAAYGLRFCALRYFNAAGATAKRGEHHAPETHLIPIVLEAAAGCRRSVSVFGDDYPTPDGTAVRDYVHIEDLGRAHLRSLDYLRGGGASELCNLGTGEGHSVLEVIDTVRAITGQPVAVEIGPRRAGDPPRLVASAERAARVLGWRPERAELADIIASAWQWRVAHPTGYAR